VADDDDHLYLRNLLGVREERLFFKDRESRFLMVNEGWLEAIAPGRSLADVVGKTDFDFFTGAHAAAAFEDEQRIIATGVPVIGRIERETFADRPDAWVATSRWPLRAGGRTVGTFGVSRTITAQMQDPATGLANRLALMDRLRQALVALERQPGCVGVLFLDIDGFKQVNDTWGHRAGDQVLAAVADRLLRVSRRFDTVARYGGDEFVLLLTAVHGESDLAAIGERVRSVLTEPLLAGDAGLPLTSSIGGALCSTAAYDPEQLVDEADRAMYRAKRDGGGRLVLFDGDLHPPLGPAGHG
jgi:diguanylate cyclase (GGDEF)-like protein